MFHDGDLQSGIGLAIAQQKSVVCFVRDETPESLEWETEWLSRDSLSTLLARTSVLLRIDAGSTEAGFLAAFCSLETIPTLVIIHNGQLKEHLVGGISQDDFTRRLRAALGDAEPQNEAQTLQPPAPQPPVFTAPEDVQAAPPSAPAAAPAYAPEPPAPLSAKAKGKQRVPGDRPSSSPSSDASRMQTEQQKTRDALRKKKREEAEELKRIQTRIEADKAERKARVEAEKAERRRLAEQQLQDETHLQSVQHIPQATSRGSSRVSTAKEVHLNVRLFDGHTIRSTFPRSATLHGDVRPWIDAEIANAEGASGSRHPPYMFKQILAPLPSRELSMSDEDAELSDVELAPSATLVLIPVKAFTEAYGGGGVVGGLVGGVTGMVCGALGLVTSTVGYVGSTLGSFIGYGATGASSESSANPRPGDTAVSNSDGGGLRESQTREHAESGGAIRVRTLADQRREDSRSQQFYNGNQLNFEPNEDEAGKK